MPSDPCEISGSPVKESVLTGTPRHYEVSPQQIGKGTYSTVLLGRDTRTGEEVAVKKMDLRRYEQEFDSEIKVLSSLQHEGIVQLKFSEIIRDTGFIYLEYISFPTLYDYVRQTRCGLSEDKAMKIFWNVLCAVEAIHLKGCAHRDLKPENLMVDPETFKIKLIDFGLSINVPRGELSENFCGSPMYMSPEVLNREKHDPQLADIWSLGVIFYHMLVGDSPWSGVDSLDELLDIVIFEPVVKLPGFLSEGIRDLLSGIFNHDPKERLSITDIKKKLEVLLSDEMEIG